MKWAGKLGVSCSCPSEGGGWMGRYGSSVGGEKQAEAGYMMKVVKNCWTDYSLGRMKNIQG